MIELWQSLTKENGLRGIFFVGRANNAAFWHIDENGNKIRDLHPNLNDAQTQYDAVINLGFDGVNSRGMDRAELIVGGYWRTFIAKIFYRIFRIGLLRKYKHEKIIDNYFVPEDASENVFPTLLPNWDRSPREGTMASLCYDCTPEVFEKDIKYALDLVKAKTEEHKIIFLQAWNEWAEGNHVEPDLKFGRGYLDALKRLLL